MNLSSLFIVPLASAAIFTASDMSDAPEAHEPAALMEEPALDGGALPVAEETPAARSLDAGGGGSLRGMQSGGLQTATLETGRLQTSGGMETGARGLTSDDEWERMFPRYAAKR